MILLLHKQEIWAHLAIQASGDEYVTVVKSFPAALKEVSTKKYTSILVDGDEFLGAVETLSNYALVCALFVDRADKNVRRAREKGAVEVLFLYDPLEKTLPKLRFLAKGVPTWEFDLPRTWHYATVTELGGVELGRTQLEILELLMEGWTTKQMAEQTGKSKGYIENILNVLYRKARVNGKGPGNRSVRLAMWGRENLGGDQ